MSLKISYPNGSRMTDKARKILEKDAKYKKKLAEKPFISPKDEKENHYLFNILFFAINLGNFATQALQRRGNLLKATAMDVIMDEMQGAVGTFRKKLELSGKEYLTEFDNFLLEMEDFAFNYVSHDKEDRIKIKKYIDHLHRQKLKNKPKS